jgi:L-lactate dehydrogenase complex protein LldG
MPPSYRQANSSGCALNGGEVNGCILPHLEDYAEVAARTSVPRNAGLVTGASGTTDIEGSYVRGAHGPRFLHVIVIMG